MAKKIRVKQLKSAIKRPQNQKRTLEALGLKRIGTWSYSEYCWYGKYS